MAGLRERFPLRRVARLLGWNLLVLFVGLVLLAGGAEVWLRVTAAPLHPPVFDLPVILAPGVGAIRPPHAEVLYTNGRDFRQTSRVNSLGFLDREPPSPERAAESCHVTLIGDSFVEGREVPLADRVQVRLEELAARELPGLDVTTSAFAFAGTAQINQLPFYDARARRLFPDVVALVFTRNDFWESSMALQSFEHGYHPDHHPHLHARWGPHGEMEFAPPAAGLEELRANRWPLAPGAAGGRMERALRERSWFADWLLAKWRGSPVGPLRWPAGPSPTGEQRQAWAKQVAGHFRGATLLEGDLLRTRYRSVLDDNPPRLYREALDTISFALEQFRERAERDGAALVILAAYDVRGEGDPWFERLRGLAAGIGEGIPVISQHDHIIAAGGRIEDARWEHEYHWNPTGHRRAAEALLEWLKANPEVCD